jgi:Zn-dependent protease
LATTPNLGAIQPLIIRARRLASTGQFEAARQDWMTILNLLPTDAPERAGVQREIDRLTDRLQPKPATDWRKKLGPFGVVLAALAKFKTALFVLLTKGKFIFSMLAFLGLYWALYGWWFAVGFFGCIFIHEMGHYVAIRRYGMKPELPMFLPGFGAYVRWQGGAEVSPGVRAVISLAGPFFGFLAGLAAFGIYLATGEHVWVAVAQVAGWLNLINLIPIGFFDGGKAMDAINLNQRIAILVLSVAMVFVLKDGNFVVWLLLAAATGYRIYKKDVTVAAEMIGYYFIALAVVNGLLSWYCMNLVQVPGRLHGGSSFF